MKNIERHFCFETTEGEFEGEQFIVFASSLNDAKETVDFLGLGPAKYICEFTEEEAEASDLDEY